MTSTMQRKNLLVVVGLILSVLSGCTLTEPSIPALSQAQLEDYLADDRFGHSSIPLSIEIESLVTLNDAWRAELDSYVRTVEDEYERYRRLRTWMFDRFEDYEFDISETYTIGELASHRKINCLSFSAMFVAAARYVDLDANFQLVSSPPYWDTDNGTWIGNQHINVTGLLEREDLQPEFSGFFRSSGAIEVVFDLGYSTIRAEGSKYRYVMDISPAVVSMPSRRRLLDETEVLSLYYSNKAVEALLDKDQNLAYTYTREALLTDSTSSVAWNNLGVLYSRIGALDLAENVYLKAIEFDDDANPARSNLASVYRRQERFAEAAPLEAEIAEYLQLNPYYHQSLAQEALDQANYQQAIQHLNDAVARKHNEFLFYHQLAIAYQKLGDRDQAIENLSNARRHARGQERARFGGKLQAMRELAAQ